MVNERKSCGGCYTCLKGAANGSPRASRQNKRRGNNYTEITYKLLHFKIQTLKLRWASGGFRVWDILFRAVRAKVYLTAFLFGGFSFEDINRLTEGTFVGWDERESRNQC